MSLDRMTTGLLGSHRCADRWRVVSGVLRARTASELPSARQSPYPDGISPWRKPSVQRRRRGGSSPAPIAPLVPEPRAPEVRAQTAASLKQRWLTARNCLLADRANKCHPGKGAGVCGRGQKTSRSSPSGGKSRGVGRLRRIQHCKSIWMGLRAKLPAAITTSAETGETSGWGQDSPFAKCKCLDRQKKIMTLLWISFRAPAAAGKCLTSEYITAKLSSF